MDVSTTKSNVASSNPTLGKAFEGALTKYNIKLRVEVKSLGVGLAGEPMEHTRYAMSLDTVNGRAVRDHTYFC